MGPFVLVLAGKNSLHTGTSTAYQSVRKATAGMKRICFVPHVYEEDEEIRSGSPAGNLRTFLRYHQPAADGCDGYLIVCGDLPHLTCESLAPFLERIEAGNTTSIALCYCTREDIADFLQQHPSAPQRIGTCVRLLNQGRVGWYKFGGVFFISTTEHLKQVTSVLGPMYENRKKPLKLLKQLVSIPMLMRFALSQRLDWIRPVSFEEFEAYVHRQFKCSASAYHVHPSLVIDED